MKKIRYIFCLFLVAMSAASFGQCFISYLGVNIGPCDPNSNNYSASGTVEFSNNPATGTLIVQIDNGTSVYDTVIIPPFTSPMSWQINNIPSDGASTTISAYFSANTSCSLTLNSVSPASCQCTADAGLYTSTITGSSTLNNYLAFGDQIDIALSSGFVAPADENISAISYDPGVGYFAYSCPPTVLPPDQLYDNMGIPADPCLIGFLTTGDTLTDVNTTGAPPNYGVSYTNNTIYYVPVTFYSMTDLYYATNSGGSDWCFDMGDPIAVTYLPKIQASQSVNAGIGEVTITLSGGYPEVFTGNYSIANNGAGTISSSTVAGSGGSFTVSGLTGGSIWNCRVQDTTGAYIEVTDTLSGDLFVNDNQLINYKLYPNPSNGTFTIDIADEKTTHEVRIINVLGEEVRSFSLGQKATISLAIENGVYFVLIDQSITKIVIQQ